MGFLWHLNWWIIGKINEERKLKKESAGNILEEVFSKILSLQEHATIFSKWIKNVKGNIFQLDW